MRTRYRIHNHRAAHFVTSTVVSWLPVFTTATRCDILVEALSYCRQNEVLQIYGWAILDNHFHAVFSAPDLPHVMADLKRHTARRVIEQLEASGAEWLLDKLRAVPSRRGSFSHHPRWRHPRSHLLFQKPDLAPRREAIFTGHSSVRLRHIPSRTASRPTVVAPAPRLLAHPPRLHISAV